MILPWRVKRCNSERWETSNKNKRPERTICAQIKTLFFGILILFSIAVLLLAVVVPSVLGLVPLTVLSGSMEPTYRVGSQVFVKAIEEDDRSTIPTGTIITFMPYPDNPTLVTHRVIDVSVDSEGVTWYTTKGDNNNVADPDSVAEYQVRAIAKYNVPYLGYISKLLTGKQKAILLSVTIGSLLIYVLYQIIMIILKNLMSLRGGGSITENNVLMDGNQQENSRD